MICQHPVALVPGPEFIAAREVVFPMKKHINIMENSIRSICAIALI
jgi:hypothetical protein